MGPRTRDGWDLGRVPFRVPLRLGALSGSSGAEVECEEVYSKVKIATGDRQQAIHLYIVCNVRIIHMHVYKCMYICIYIYTKREKYMCIYIC